LARGVYKVLQYTPGILKRLAVAVFAITNLVGDMKNSTTIQEESNPLNFRHPYYANYTGQASDWSNTQTINISTGEVSTSNSPIPTPFVPEFSWLAVAPLLFSIFSVVLVVRHRKTANLKH